MDETNILKSFFELASGVDKIPCLANLSDVLLKADTPFRRCISESDVDDAVDALKDFKHSEISKSTGYANDWQRENAKNIVSAVAEDVKKWVKDFLRVRGLLVTNGY